MIAFDDAVGKIDRIIIRARRMGIRTYAKVAHMNAWNHIGYDVAHGWQADTVCTAASINKLLVATYRMGMGASAPYAWTDEYVRPGGGLYDQPGALRSATAGALMHDMLAHSGNTAMVVLGRYEADAVNRHVAERCRYWEDDLRRGREYAVSRLVPAHDGFFETGQTTPEEALGLIMSVLGTEALGSVMVMQTQGALARSTSHIPKPMGVEIAGKHGELNGPDNDGVFVRNEIGRINAFTPDLASYAVFTETDSALQAKVAEQVIGQIGSVLMEVTGVKASRIAKLIGKTALAT